MEKLGGIVLLLLGLGIGIAAYAREAQMSAVMAYGGMAIGTIMAVAGLALLTDLGSALKAAWDFFVG